MLCRRQIDGIGFGDGRRACPVATHFSIYNVDAHFGGLAIVLIEQRRVFFYRKINHHGVAVHAGLVELSLTKVSLHDIARNLVEMKRVGQLLHEQ